MKKNIALLLLFIFCMSSGTVFAHGATYEVKNIGENTVGITVNAGPEQTSGVEIRSYTVRAGNTININYGYSKEGKFIDTIKIDARTILFPVRIILTNVDDEQSVPFADIVGIKNQDYIWHLHSAGIITGTPEGTYLPNDSITRAEFVTIITKALGFGEEFAWDEAWEFNDIKNHWAKGRIISAINRKIVNGLPDGSFKPDSPVSVAEAGAIVCRAFNIQQTGSVTYQKLDEAHWAHEYMTALFEAGVVEQNDELCINFEEDAKINRADCAMLISRALVLHKN